MSFSIRSLITNEKLPLFSYLYFWHYRLSWPIVICRIKYILGYAGNTLSSVKKYLHCMQGLTKSSSFVPSVSSYVLECWIKSSFFYAHCILLCTGMLDKIKFLSAYCFSHVVESKWCGYNLTTLGVNRRHLTTPNNRKAWFHVWYFVIP